MASSDDEDVFVPQSVTNYYFVDETEAPISFSVLPIQLDEPETPNASEDQVFLHGTTDGGLQKVYKQVTAWKLGLNDEQPEVLVLSKDKNWITLLKPRKSYEDCIRTTLITIQLLHFLKKNPDASEKSLWDNLCRVFSLFEDRPSEKDLRHHHSLLKLFMEKDGTLMKSELLQMFLSEKPRRKTFGEDLQNDLNAKKSFIVDDDVDEVMEDDDADDSEDESDVFDSVCAICDNGGELLCCEGRCMRSFHASRKDGEDSDCKSLGFSRAQVEAIQNFLCKNCLYKQHQCFACGKLGSSDKSVGAEVFPCVSATCGHFYHPKCVAELLFPDNETEANEYQNKIVAGESFTCPIHKCIVCKQGENKEVKELQFAMCRRCPKSYHRKCLPRKIAFEDIEEEGIIQRAWDDLLPNRILIYCLKHKIDDDIGTPIRNHIIFPEDPEKKKVVDVPKNKVKVLAKKNRQVSDGLPRTSIKPIKESVQSISKKVDGFLGDTRKPSKEMAKASVLTGTPASAGKKFGSSFPLIDGETEKKMSALMEKVSSSLTLDDIIKKYTVPSTHAYCARHIDKTITHGKVEGSIEAIRTALQKLEAGSSVEDAKTVCEADILKQILKWNNKLKVYLAPFLHGMRYTSFGRHFTKVDKLQEIVDKLQWYVQNGDTIVDFCCGANDFSQLMKEKLDAAGKKCSFKNYDVIYPKNDFSFEQRDWMKVHPKELPTGSQLIMGLNPPFGVKAALANKFIDKALTFKPKLLILIVPKETERLDQKSSPYDLIWEDSERLSGKSFYLPGSVDANDKQMEQWNLKPPPLYLWSRPDWTAKHKAISLKRGHTSKEQSESRLQVERTADALPAVEDHHTEERRKMRLAPPGESEREGRNKNEPKNKRVFPENHKGRPPKRRRRKRKQLEASEKRMADELEASERRKADELSDMSISSSDTTDPQKSSLSRYPTSETFDTPTERIHNHRRSGSEFGTVTGVGGLTGVSGLTTNISSLDTRDNLSMGHYPTSDTLETLTERRSNHGVSASMFATITGPGGRTTNIVEEDIHDIAKRYTASPFNSHNWSGGGVDSQDYRLRTSEEQFPSYSGVDAFSRTYMDGYDRSSDFDARMQQPRHYSMQGHDHLLQRGRFSLGGSDTGLSPSYGHLSSTATPSVMQRYTSRLDETNYPRAENLGQGGPAPPVGRSSIFDMPGIRTDMPRPDSLGFAPGPHPFPRQGSGGGWLED